MNQRRVHEVTHTHTQAHVYIVLKQFSQRRIQRNNEKKLIFIRVAKIPSTRPRAPCVFRFNSTEMASRTLQSQRPL